MENGENIFDISILAKWSVDNVSNFYNKLSEVIEIKRTANKTLSTMIETLKRYPYIPNEYNYLEYHKFHEQRMRYLEGVVSIIGGAPVSGLWNDVREYVMYRKDLSQMWQLNGHDSMIIKLTPTLTELQQKQIQTLYIQTRDSQKQGNSIMNSVFNDVFSGY